MLLIDRYILWQFISVFVICFVSLAGLFIVADALGHLDEFVTASEKAGGSLFTLMASFYGPRLIWILDRTSGVLTLISAMFTIAWFQRHNEMTALMAAGVSKARIIRPLIIAVGVLSLIAALNRELVIPHFREELSRTTQDLAPDAAKKLVPLFDNQTGIFINGGKVLTNQRTIADPSFRMPRELSQYGRHISAHAAIYYDATADHPAGYLFQAISEPHDLTKRASLSLNDQPVILTPSDNAWLAADQCFVVSEIAFDQLVDPNGWRQYSSTWELVQGLYNRSLDFGADVRVTVHARMVQPVLDLTLLFLGLPLILKGVNRNMFVAIGLCLGVVIGFLLIVLGFQYLGSSILLSPVTAVWIPLFLFIPLAAWMAEPIWQ
ncbi:MAG: LptF/LptG family permease [Planctomycetota bacterium]|nr:LptF/LptG family permease [Planctomycetota bacterium]